MYQEPRRKSFSKGARGKSKKANSNQKWSQNINLHEGALTQYGYVIHEPEEKRHSALLTSIQTEGFNLTRQRLQLLTNLSNNKEVDQTVQADLKWMDALL